MAIIEYNTKPWLIALMITPGLISAVVSIWLLSVTLSANAQLFPQYCPSGAVVTAQSQCSGAVGSPDNLTKSILRLNNSGLNSANETAIKAPPPPLLTSGEPAANNMTSTTTTAILPPARVGGGPATNTITHQNPAVDLNISLRNVGPAYSCGGITLNDYRNNFAYTLVPPPYGIPKFCAQQFQKAYDLLLERDAAPGIHLRVNSVLTMTKPYDTILNGTFTIFNPRTGENLTVPTEKNVTASGSFNPNYVIPDSITTIQKSPCTWDGVALGDDTVNANIHLEAIDDNAEWAFDADAMSLYQTLQQKDRLLPDLYWCGEMP